MAPAGFEPPGAVRAHSPDHIGEPTTSQGMQQMSAILGAQASGHCSVWGKAEGPTTPRLRLSSTASTAAPDPREEACGALTPTHHAPMPETPRRAPAARSTSPATPPRTPRRWRDDDGKRTVPEDPPSKPRVAPMPPLLRALVESDEENVRKALAEDPEAAQMPFMDHDWEPPLCAAARLGCPSPVFALLLEYRADPNQENVHGQTALQVLVMSVMAPSQQEFKFEDIGLRQFREATGLIDLAVIDEMRQQQRRQEALVTAGLLVAAGADSGRALAACQGGTPSPGVPSAPVGPASDSGAQLWKLLSQPLAA
mmetsp:Transcript_75986/g.197726  ORF Transcript_75986/g.197726 Transcript_75986/m.197726 type:complete len:312 (+) Transcript_75986:70-1005(+)